MGWYYCGDLKYPFFVEWKDGTASIPLLDPLLSKFSHFAQGERDGEGHSCVHLKGSTFKAPSSIRLPGAKLELVLIPERNPGTPSYEPARYGFGYAGYYYTMLAGAASNSYAHIYGGISSESQSGFTLTTRSTNWPGTVSGLGGTKTVSIDGPTSDGRTLLATWNEESLMWDGSIRIQSGKSELPLLLADPGEMILSDDAEGIASIIGGRIYSLYEDLLEGFESHFHGNYSYVCADACESIRYDHHNTILNTMEILNFKKDVGDMYSSFKELLLPSSPSKKMKQAASAYLGTKYGPRLSLLELGDIINAEHNKKSKGSTTGSREVEWSTHGFNFSGVDRVSFDYEYGVYNSVMSTLGSWGLSPVTLADLWDAVPYSFVVDWFVDVSDMLENPSRRGFIDSLPVKNIWASEKGTASGTLKNATTNASVSYNLNLYVRDAKEALGTQLNGYTTSSSISAQNHIPELGAVLVNLLL